jgi:N-acetyl-anhydromuramyl-L-alanine amidase AmpD
MCFDACDPPISAAREYKDIERLFCNNLDFGCHPFYGEIDGLTVSAHLLIRRDGQVVQFVPFPERARMPGLDAEAHARERLRSVSNWKAHYVRSRRRSGALVM